MENMDTLTVIRFLSAQERLEEAGFRLEISGDLFSVSLGETPEGSHVLFVNVHSVAELCVVTDILCHLRLAEIAKQRRPVPKE